MPVGNLNEVRADWTHAMTNALQRFVGRTLTADAWDFERAARLLCREIPPPPSLHDREQLRTELFACACRSSLHLHARYHQNIPSQHCGGSPIEDIVTHWTDRESDPRLTFRHWVCRFLAAFQAGHPWPAAIEASAVLRSRFRRRIGIIDLSREVGASRSRLILEFRRYFGVSIGEYQRVLRLRWAIPRLRDPRRDADRVAVRAGFRNAAVLDTHLRAHTGLDIRELRGLSSAQTGRVLATVVLPSALRAMRPLAAPAEVLGAQQRIEIGARRAAARVGT
jgi:AraC-like DNA-binding protein